jgi:SAM-dependent methyltransferase
MSHEFDRYAAQYADALQQGLALTGESQDFFAEGRVRWVRHRWQQRDPLGMLDRQDSPRAEPLSILDYGCGTGGTSRIFLEQFNHCNFWGIDSSPASIAQANRRFANSQCRFVTTAAGSSLPAVDLVYCNGVFHHIEPSERSGVVGKIRELLKPGGWFCLWENNPWNPGTRMVMKRIPFDRDAIPLTSRESKTLLQQAGFRIVRVDYCFYFPRSLAILRPLEPFLCRLPLGGQYCVFGEKS